MSNNARDTFKIAVFFDLENVATGTGEGRFDVQTVIKRLLEMNYSNPLTVHVLKMDPAFDALRHNPDFKALIPANI